jgi:hypothetical protein
MSRNLCAGSSENRNKDIIDFKNEKEGYGNDQVEQKSIA